MKTSKVVSTILTVVMVIECILIVITSFIFWQEFTYDYSWHEDEDSLVYELENERYGHLLCAYYSNEYGGYKATGDMKECYGVAKYFEAALWYNAYEHMGDVEKCAVYVKKMEMALEEMGDYQFLEEKIRTKLNME